MSFRKDGHHEFNITVYLLIITYRRYIQTSHNNIMISQMRFTFKIHGLIRKDIATNIKMYAKCILIKIDCDSCVLVVYYFIAYIIHSQQ